MKLNCHAMKKYIATYLLKLYKYIYYLSHHKCEFVLVRTYSAGVFAGYLEKREGKEVTLTKAIRIWYWDGAASLSQLAMEGVTKPENCKFAMPVNEIILIEAIEIIPITKKAEDIIKSVKSWKQ